MKKIILLLMFCVFLLGESMAQTRYGFVDTKYILEKIPEYTQAQVELDKASQLWQSDIETIYTEIQLLNTKLRSDQVFLSPQMKTKREKEIAKKESQAQEMQNRYFGVDGELFLKRQELIKPIQDGIFDVIKEIAKAGNYGMIIDRASGVQLIYSNPKFDLSDKVISKLGYR